MSKSWNFNTKDVRRDGVHNKKRPKPDQRKSEKRREQRAIQTGDTSFFEDDDYYPDRDFDDR